MLAARSSLWMRSRWIKTAWVAFEWSASSERTRVTIKLNADHPNTSVVTVKRPRFPMDDAGVKRAMGQPQDGPTSSLV